MSYLNDLNSGSSDSEDDADYVPNNISDSEQSETEEYGEEQKDDDVVEVCDEHEEPKPKKVKLSEPSPPVVNKSVDDVWSSFLESVKSSPYGKVDKQEEKNETTKKSDTQSDAVKVPEKASEQVPTSLKTEPMSKETLFAKSGDSVAESPIKKPVECEKVKGDTKNEKPDVLITRPPPRTGLASFLTSISKNKKQSVLEKSLDDWKQFKKDEGIEKDLETFNKGRDGFIERQRFLQRADVREFENEKSIRMGTKRK